VSLAPKLLAFGAGPDNNAGIAGLISFHLMRWPMNRSHAGWCLLAAVVVFGPVGLRVLCCWERSKPKPVDPDQALAGAALFVHDWQAGDPLSPEGDGLGPVFNARSCVACHHQGGTGGGGGLEHNVTTYLVQPTDGRPQREGVIHSDAIGPQYRETLALLDPKLPAISKVPLNDLVPTRMENGFRFHQGNALDVPSHIQLSQRNTPALFGAKLIDEIPDRAIIAEERAQRVRNGMAPTGSETVPVGRASRLASGKIGHFGWKGQTATLSDFVQGACANELGLGNPGQAQPVSLADAGYRPKGLDLTQQQCDQLTAFVAGLDRPVERLPADPTLEAQGIAGRKVFERMGCADCHVPNLGGVEGLYSDLLMHRMGKDLVGGSTGYDGQPIPPKPIPDITTSDSFRPLSDEWRTPPLWGVADSAPYMHDGRAATLEDAIKMHAGQGTAAAARFVNASQREQDQLLAFLRTLRAP
jgi:CxxC motif-containing protein (DUF1111 family)